MKSRIIMATNADVMKKLKELLKDNMPFVKNMFLGQRKNITSYPCVCLLPQDETEREERYPNQIVDLTVVVIGINHIIDADEQIVSNETSKNLGILDFANEIKKVIDSDRTLCGTAIDMVYGVATYAFSYPEVYVELPVTISYPTFAEERK